MLMMRVMAIELGNGAGLYILRSHEAARHPSDFMTPIWHPQRVSDALPTTMTLLERLGLDPVTGVNILVASKGFNEVSSLRWAVFAIISILATPKDS